VDYLRTVPEVADLFGLYGVSLGGHYVVRAAAFEPRIAACVSVSGSFRVADNWSRRPPMSRAAYRIRAHLASDEATAEFVEQLDLTGVADRVSCPLYVVAGTADRLTPHVDGIRIAEAAGGPTVLDVVEGGNHVVNNMPYRYRPQVADWLKVTLTP
jgi:2,6-dihydroxypseudooxynicotine hydrolase